MVKQYWSPMGIISPGSPGPYEKAFTDALGKYGDGYMSCVPWYNPTKPKARGIAARFEKETDGRFDLNAGKAFAFEARPDRGRCHQAGEFQRAGGDPRGSENKSDIGDHIVYGGPIRFDERGQNPNIGVVMLQNQNGRPVVVSPADASEAKAIFPFVPFDKR